MPQLLGDVLVALHQYADAAEDVVWLATRSGKVVYINVAWTRLTGQSVTDAEGHGWRKALHNEDVDAILNALERSARDLRNFRQEIRVTDGTILRWMLSSGWPYYDRSGSSELYVGTVRPIRFHEGVATEMGASALTRREGEVLEWLAAGKTAHEIGIILGISKRTVEEHVKNAMFKTGAANSTQAVVEAIRKGAIVV